ncbi:MAG: type II toxin-antitoxin system MqsA family antitoxin [Gallionella sp.]|nr:type II toxin-antitoxin system MqsA family antitoxin [Gallionella sp.]
MKNMHICPICDEGILQARTYGRDMQHKGVNISVEGLQYDYCLDCEAEMTSPVQLDQNAKIIREAFIAERARVKCEQNLLTGTQIRRVREQLGITQKQASKIFGGGPTAFAKYEAEDVVQSAGMDKLLRLASEVPAATEWLLDRAGEGINRVHMEHEALFAFQDLRAVASSMHKMKLPDWFAEDGNTKHGKFDLSSVACCNDGAYADAA